MRTNSCIHWYWHYTLHDEFGNVWVEWDEYIGTTCEGEDCEDPYNSMLCPESGGGGGGGGDEDLYDIAAENAIISEVYSASSQPAFQSVNFSSPEPDEELVYFTWVIVRNASNLWQVTSTDIAKGYRSSNPNIGSILYDIEHSSSAISGQTFWCRVPKNFPGPCIPLINLSWQESSSSKTIASNYKSGKVTISGQLKNFGITINSYTQSCTVNV